MAGEVIEATEQHVFYIDNVGWIPASMIEEGDKVVLQSGDKSTVEKIDKVVHNELITVYNFEVEDFHTYFVSDASVLVHNTASCAEKTYQTYTKTNSKTGEVYSGRTSGKGSPIDNVKKRDAKHHMNKKGFGPAVLDKSSSNKNAIRGREQQLIDKHGGAKSMGGTSGNAVNGISKKNKNRQKYLRAARKEFG